MVDVLFGNFFLKASLKSGFEVPIGLSDCSNKEGYLKLLKERTKLDIIKGYLEEHK